MKDVIDIASRWEPLVDGSLIDQLDGTTHRLHPPVRRELVLEMNGLCEQCTSYYHNLFRDGDRIRMYYRGLTGSHLGEDYGNTANLAESNDGIHFTRPDLGVAEVKGTMDNNAIWTGVGSHNFHCFRDDNPAADPEQRYKAVGSGGMGKLYGFYSPDGVHWRLAQEDPLPITGNFDSLNVAYWDPRMARYRLFSRYFDKEISVRAIQSCESEDFLDWTEPVPHQYADDAPWEHFYTNATVPCPDAEHILLSFPMRFVPDRTRCTDGMVYPGDGLSDSVFMTSRDGVHWDRTFLDAYLRPGLNQRNWAHRNNQIAAGIIPTADDEWSLYVGENYAWDTNRLRRLTVRPLGFASVHADRGGGEFLTKPLTFTGRRLHLNYATSVVGSIEVTVCDPDGQPLEGLSGMDLMFGDELEAAVSYDLTPAIGSPVRLRFHLQDADLFAIRTADLEVGQAVVLRPVP